MARLTDVADRRESRVPMSLRARWTNIREDRTPIIQLSVGAGIAWFVAHNIVGHQQPFFAPIAAILIVVVGVARRRRTALELVLGVSVGILVGELLITVIGRGGWQIVVVVALAVLLATFLGLPGFARNQSATSAALIAAIAPIAGTGNVAVNRFGDALVGGIVGMVMTVVVPGNPVRHLDRQVQTVLRGLADLLDLVTDALQHHDAGPAWTALQQARALQPTIEKLGGTATRADEVARMSPLRWRQRRHVRLYSGALSDIDNAVRDARVLSRRVHTMLRQRESPPRRMVDAVGHLANAVRVFSDDLTEQDEFDEAQEKLVKAAREATQALPGSATMNLAATAAQVRSLASDLLYATGSTPPEIDDLLNTE